MPFAIAFGSHASPRFCHQCTTIPDYERVNARKAPIAKNGIRVCVSLLKKMINAPATNDNTRMPFVKTSRSLNPVSWRGLKSSFARMAATRGKSIKLVLAATASMSRVENWMIKYSGLLPNNHRANADKIFSCGPATTSRNWVRPILPTNIMPISRAITTNIRKAFLDYGDLKAATPLLIASILVKAVHPVEKHSLPESMLVAQALKLWIQK